MITEANDIETVRSLFESYMWHMKQYNKIEDVDAWVVRANQYFNLYGTEPERKVYIFTQKNVISGFSLVNREYRFNTTGNTIAEFYITPKEQKMELGKS